MTAATARAKSRNRKELQASASPWDGGRRPREHATAAAPTARRLADQREARPRAIDQRQHRQALRGEKRVELGLVPRQADERRRGDRRLRAAASELVLALRQRSELHALLGPEIGRVMRMNTGSTAETQRLLPRHLYRATGAVDGAAGDDHACDPGAHGPFDDGLAIGIEALVRQVQPDIDEFRSIVQWTILGRRL